ncbi:hypothetical protein Ancab_034091 [Ancistrocladus abbreviatus]
MITHMSQQPICLQSSFSLLIHPPKIIELCETERVRRGELGPMNDGSQEPSTLIPIEREKETLDAIIHVMKFIQKHLRITPPSSPLTFFKKASKNRNAPKAMIKLPYTICSLLNG